MRKLMTLLILAVALVLAGCCDNGERRTRECDYGKPYMAARFEYNGHRYLSFVTELIHGPDSMTGVVHDPDCPCHNSDNRQLTEE